MSKKLKIAIISVVVIAIFFAGYYSGIFLTKKEAENAEMQKEEQAEKENRIVVYGSLRHFSNVGAMTFNYYDIRSDSVVDDGMRPWFWADTDMDNKERISIFIDLIDNNKDSVFKIVGKKREDNCGFEKGFCFEDIGIDEITIVGKANLSNNKDNIDYDTYGGETTNEEEKIMQDGRIDGFYDAIYLDRSLKQGYIEPDAQDYLKYTYFYGYLLGYDVGCRQVQRESEDCKNALEILKETFDIPEQEDDVYADPFSTEIIT